MTITIAFHQSYYRNFKGFYLNQVMGHWLQAFPGVGKLSTFCRMDAFHLNTLEHLSAQLFWSMYGGVCNGLHQDSGVS